MTRWMWLTCCLAVSAGAEEFGHGMDSAQARQRARVLEGWRQRVAVNGGVHSWSPKTAGAFVFQEWAALLALARDSGTAARRRWGSAFERYVVDGRIRPLGHQGTTIPLPGVEEGDFDMIALKAVSLVGMFERDRLLLTDKTYAYLVRDVIRTFGDVPQSSFDVGFIRFPETENHLFMIESNRFLMNELVRDNPRGLRAIVALRDSLRSAGALPSGRHRAFLLRRLQSIVYRGFFEFNARVYQRFTAQALDNLVSFARDSAVAKGAGCALDHLSAVFSLQSLGSIRYGPYRRSSETYDDVSLSDRDALSSFFAAQTGIVPWDTNPRDGFWQRHPAHATSALFSLLLRYRVPGPMLAFMRQRATQPEFEAVIRSGHSASGAKAVTEHYTGGPKYQLSAGGRYEPYAGADFPALRHWPHRSPWVYDVIARPATLMLYPPPGRMERESDVIRTRTAWDGDQLALHRRFLYAYAPAESYEGREWPFAVPPAWCPDTSEHLTPSFRFRFCDASSWGVLLVFSKVRPTSPAWLWRHQTYVRGGLEIIPLSEGLSLADVVAKTLAANAAKPASLRLPLPYVTWDGARLAVNPRYQPGTVGIFPPEDTAPPPRGDLPWPREWGGDLLQARLLGNDSGWLASSREGLLLFRNPVSGMAVECDFREWWRPMRRLRDAR